VYLDTARFERNLRPAVDIGRSVSRVGGAAQPAVMRATARNLRVMMSRFEALETLTQVGLDVDPSTKLAVERGRMLRELLRQPRFSVRSVDEQIFALTAVSEGWLDDLEPASARDAVWSAATEWSERRARPGGSEATGGAVADGAEILRKHLPRRAAGRS
jgi:F-type H+-transporting ATPase subunit alpha